MPPLKFRPFFLIAGPCVIESKRLCLDVAKELKRISRQYHLPVIFKASYDKANRSSHESYRGPGLQEGLKILSEIRSATGLPLLTDVHTSEEAIDAGRVVDVLQIPAFLCRQTDLLMTAAKTGRWINVKKGQFLSPWDMKNVAEKMRHLGAGKRTLFTERGTTFGYNNLVVDFRGIPVMKTFGFPVVFDATHSVQRPGGAGKSTGGDSSFVPTLARAAVAAGCDGLFIETHPHPSKALSDGPNMVPLGKLSGLIKDLLRIRKALHTS